MVTTDELRLGNFLRAAGAVYIVTALSPDKVETRHRDGGPGEQAIMQALEYVPLSAEWMNYFAGDESGSVVVSSLERTSTSSDMIILSTVECYLHDDGFLRVCAYEYEKQQDSLPEMSDDVIMLGYSHIRYVHQFQNLYFFLAGKELEPKKKPGRQ